MSHDTLLDLSRWQWALTAAMHITFPAVTVGTSVFLVACYAMLRRRADALELGSLGLPGELALGVPRRRRAGARRLRAYPPVARVQRPGPAGRASPSPPRASRHACWCPPIAASASARSW
jgi:hypothetical protein